ncbi:G-type lectin S-receptor-like serine/threonine-protein kinase SD2-5 isoform X2 [Populus nigra]|uniref:G-type lectin S-receptor-like serine/threonine-protein kinase SD2-5 isoform X2 n=1 Tax=Populus nigra TaxID=3691 RepID=UPI002B26BCE0|nr:G-type lectin S-receptor-like serine/threonine-protein kinase SD2-5 isoform X2 [Populus nigra]
MSLLKLLMHLSPFLVAHLFVSGINSTYDPRPLFYVTPTIPTGNTIGCKALTSNKPVFSSGPVYAVARSPLDGIAVRSSGPAEPPIIAPSLSPQVKKPPSLSPQGITPPRPSPQGIAPPRPSPEISPRSSAPIIAAVIFSFVVIIPSVVMPFILRARWRGKSEQDPQDVEDDHIKHVPGMPVRFSYQQLYVATNNFNERLGRGGFGSVFKGKLGDGTQIAVKRLEKRGQGMSAFLAEAEAIGSLHHFNLVRLIGFCAEKSSRLLVFEYLSNGSLDNWIFMNVQGSFLDWQTRKKIILDIAKGLAYLHEDCRHTIIHLDVKPQNILLDSSFHAKIADFGLSKLINRDMSQVQISMRGTPGYLAPEWRQPLGRITVKVDIYSFGIVLLEIVCARRNVDQSQPESAFHLLTMLQKKADHQDGVIDIVENLDEYTRSDREEITRMIKVAAWCLQDDPERRPLMSTVLKVLEGVMEVDSKINYRFSHAMISSPAGNNHISSAPPPASVLSNPR